MYVMVATGRVDVRLLTRISIWMGLLGVVGLVACATEPDLARLDQPIIDAELIEANEHPEAVFLLAVYGDDEVLPLCSAALIAPDVVLTAAHCLGALVDLHGDPIDDQGLRCVSFDTDYTDLLEGDGEVPADAVCGSEFFQHPDFEPNTFPDGVMGNRNDLGLLFLDEPVDDRDFAYLPDGIEGELLFEGMELELVGYGYYETIDATGMAEKAAATTVLEMLGEHEVLVGNPGAPRGCFGDSGGPAFAELDVDMSMKRRLVGITSRAFTVQDETCGEGSVSVRVDAVWGWIDDELRLACEDGVRVQCDDPGLPDPADAGCACSASGGRVSGSLVGVLALAAAAISRRRAV